MSTLVTLRAEKLSAVEQKYGRLFWCSKLAQAPEDSAAGDFLRHLQILNGKKAASKRIIRLYMLFYIKHLFKQGENLQRIPLSPTLPSQVAAYS